MVGRYLLAFLALALVVWLFVDSGSDEKFRKHLDTALADGKIGLLTKSERKHFSNVFQWWLKSAGYNQLVNLDKPYKPGALNFYSTDKKSAGLPRISPGNAAYDPNGDAIFISIELFRPTLVVQLYGYIDIQRRPNQLPVTSGYLLFVFLHELGHRTLHGGVYENRIRNISDEAIFEEEADEFAIKIMQNAYTSVVPSDVKPSYIAPVTPPLRIVDNIETLTSIWTTEDPYLVIAGSIYQMTNSMMHTETLVSPYYSDSAHSPFILRALRLVDAALSKSLEKWNRSYIQIVREHLLRVQRTLQIPMIEVQLQMPIVAAEFLENDLRIFGQGKGGTSRQDFRIPLKEIDNILCRSVSNILVIRPKASKNDLRTISTELSGSSAYVNGHKWVISPDSQFGTSSWSFFMDQKLIGQIPMAMLMNYLRATNKLIGEAEIKAISILRNTAIFLVQTNESRGNRNSVGYIQVGLPSFKPINYVELNVDFPDNSDRSFWFKDIEFLDDHGSVSPYLAAITYSARTRHPTSIAVWKLSSGAKPELVGNHPMTVSNIESAWDLSIFQRVSVPFVTVNKTGNAKGLLIDVYLDSLYYFDLDTRSLEFLFHPGGTRQTSYMGSYVAVFANGANKIYVMRLPPSENFQVCE